VHRHLIAFLALMAGRHGWLCWSSNSLAGGARSASTVLNPFAYVVCCIGALWRFGNASRAMPPRERAPPCGLKSTYCSFCPVRPLELRCV